MTPSQAYFPLWFDVQGHYGIAGFDRQKNKKPYALLFFDPRMREIHRSWPRQLLTTPNPYTGKTLAKETALAIVEIVNEDSFFFWTFSRKNIPEVHWRRLERIFARWLAKRHGSLGEAMARWGKTRSPGDDPKAGRVRLFDAWHMTSAALEPAAAGRKRRISDQVRFLAARQREFYASTTRFIKKTLGYGGLVSASNWHVSDAPLLDGLERWTYTAGDVAEGAQAVRRAMRLEDLYALKGSGAAAQGLDELRKFAKKGRAGRGEQASQSAVDRPAELLRWAGGPRNRAQTRQVGLRGPGPLHRPRRKDRQEH